MNTFRPKPRVFQAIRGAEVITGYATNPSTLPQWVQDAYEGGRIVAITAKSFTLKDADPCMGGDHVEDHDWLTLEADGTLHVVPKEEFERYYETA